MFRLIASWFYGIAVWIRNTLYDEKVLRSIRVSVPTICVGNLSVGGTGKTPHTEFIASELSKQFKVAVLSRGYKRKTRGFVLADDASTTKSIGDEPMQMHLNLPDVPIAVCEDRVQGVKRLKQIMPDLQVVVLDDAYQHRHIKCGYYVLLTAADNLYVNDHLLPRGRLREQKHGSLRANSIVVTKCDPQLKPIDKRIIETTLRVPNYQSVFFSQIEYDHLQPIVAETECKPHKPLVVTGIANPKPMIDYLKLQYPDLQAISFADHYNFKKKDISRIKELINEYGLDSIITTQKDIVRILEQESFDQQLQNMTFMLPISVKLNDEKAFLKDIIRYVTENNRGNSKSK